MNISKQEENDLKKLAVDYQVDYSELVEAYKITNKQFDKIIKTTSDKEEKEKVLNDIEKEIDEAIKKITKLKNDGESEESIDRQVEDVETVQRSLKALKEEGLIETYEGDENTTKEDN